MENRLACPAQFPYSLVSGHARLARARRIPMAHPVLESVLFNGAAELARTVGTQRLAQRSHHNRIAALDSLVRVVARILASGNDLCQR
jgi:hypothetical protein